MNPSPQDSIYQYQPSADSLSVDSVLQMSVEDRVEEVFPKLFNMQQVQNMDLSLVERQKPMDENVWVNIGLWVVVLAYLVLRRVLNVSFAKTVKFLVRIPAVNQTTFDKPSLSVQLALFVPCFAFFVFFVYVAWHNIVLFDYMLPPLSWWYIAVFLFVFTGGIFLLELLFSVLFDVSYMFEDYLTDQLLLFNAGNVVLLPFTLFYFYEEVNMFLYIGLAIVVVSTVLRWFRGSFIAYRQTFFSVFYIFVYLCSVKIIPFFLLVKWVFGQKIFF
ncbi:MAG: hypothetical protein CSB02_00670 [Bacteroidia bacterium]|nr:MAG: hypothetical protein CSB02_00670 [Bacteroidia bacterium]